MLFGARNSSWNQTPPMQTIQMPTIIQYMFLNVIGMRMLPVLASLHTCPNGNLLKAVRDTDTHLYTVLQVTRICLNPCSDILKYS